MRRSWDSLEFLKSWYFYLKRRYLFWDRHQITSRQWKDVTRLESVVLSLYVAPILSIRWRWLYICDFNDDVIKWKHFQRYWSFVRGVHWLPVNSLHKGQWRGVLTFSLICAWINGWVNNRETSDLRRHLARYDVTLMFEISLFLW